MKIRLIKYSVICAADAGAAFRRSGIVAIATQNRKRTVCGVKKFGIGFDIGSMADFRNYLSSQKGIVESIESAVIA